MREKEKKLGCFVLFDVKLKKKVKKSYMFRERERAKERETYNNSFEL